MYSFFQKNKPLILAGGMVFSALTATAQDKVTVAPPTGENICLMSEMDLTKVTCFDDEGRTKVRKNLSTLGREMVMKDSIYACGVGTHAPSKALVKLNGATRFVANLGIDDGADLKEAHGIVNYCIKAYKADGTTTKVLQTGTINRTDKATVKVNLDLTGYAFLELDLQDGEHPWADHVDWGNAHFVCKDHTPAMIAEAEMNPGDGGAYVNLPSKGREGEEIVPLSSLDISKGTCGWSTIKANKSIDNNPITLKDTVYASGVGTHTESRIIVKLNGAVTHFVGSVGIDDEVKKEVEKDPSQGICNYRVVLKAENGDERVCSEGTISLKDRTTPAFDIDCNGWKYLILEATPGDNNYSDHVDWANAYFEYVEQNSTKPVIVTEEEISSKLACATQVFSQPGVRFMQKIRALNPEATVTVTGLPEGLTWNAKRQLIEGCVTTTGNYEYTAMVTTNGETTEEKITLTVSDKLDQPVPLMGWLSWNVVEGNISENVVKTVADAMVSSGLAKAGYNYLIIDDLWHADQRETGTNKPVEDAQKFPNGMKACADYVHSKGLKFGIYSDAGTKTCAGEFGSYGFEEIDAKQYAAWDVDLLKYDYCFAPSDVETSKRRYQAMGNALKKSGRDILFYMCEWGVREPWKWGSTTGASTWRCTYDTRDCWVGRNGGIGVVQSIEGMRDLWMYSGPNRYNDADMMCVGIHGTGKSSSDLCEGTPGMTMTEYRSQFSMWCMWASPLTLSFDLRKPISKADLDIMTNEEMIAINQDRMGQQAEFIGEYRGVELYMKDLENGDIAVAAINLGDAPRKFTIDFNLLPALSANDTYRVRDLWLKKDLGEAKGSFDAGTLAKHETKVFRISKANQSGVAAVVGAENNRFEVKTQPAALHILLPGAVNASKRVLISDLKGRVLASACTSGSSLSVPFAAPKGSYVANVVCNGRSQSVKFAF